MSKINDTKYFCIGKTKKGKRCNKTVKFSDTFCNVHLKQLIIEKKSDPKSFCNLNSEFKEEFKEEPNSCVVDEDKKMMKTLIKVMRKFTRISAEIEEISILDRSKNYKKEWTSLMKQHLRDLDHYHFETLASRESGIFAEG